MKRTLFDVDVSAPFTGGGLMKLIATILFLMPFACVATDCDNAISTPEINACASAEYQKADAALNAMYKRVMDAYKDGEREAKGHSTKDDLVQAQRAWVKFRESNCKAVGDRWQQGTIGGSMAITCLQELTEQRTAQLYAQFLRDPDEPDHGP